MRNRIYCESFQEIRNIFLVTVLKKSSLYCLYLFFSAHVLYHEKKRNINYFHLNLAIFCILIINSYRFNDMYFL